MGHGSVKDVDWVGHCLTNLSTPDLPARRKNENRDISLNVRNKLWDMDLSKM